MTASVKKPKCVVLPWSKEVPKGDQFGIHRFKQPSDDPNTMAHQHIHDGFVELFWVEQGEGLHYINGQKLPLKENDLMLIREHDQHSYQALSPTLTFVNLTFSLELMQEMRERYFKRSKQFFAREGVMPFQMSLSPFQRRWLDENAPALGLGTRTRFDIEAFLLPLFHHLFFPGHRVKIESCPDWLQNAHSLIRDPEHSILGIREFERLCGRSQEHVARVTRKWLGTTPLVIVNQARLEHAAKKISETDQKISDIALDVGFNNLASFYRLFQKVYKVPPRRYRLQKQITF